MDLGRTPCLALQLVGVPDQPPLGERWGREQLQAGWAGSGDRRANIRPCPKAGGAEPQGAPARTLKKVNFKITHEATLSASVAVGVFLLGFFVLPWKLKMQLLGSSAIERKHGVWIASGRTWAALGCQQEGLTLSRFGSECPWGVLGRGCVTGGQSLRLGHGKWILPGGSSRLPGGVWVLPGPWSGRSPRSCC